MSKNGQSRPAAVGVPRASPRQHATRRPLHMTWKFIGVPKSKPKVRTSAAGGTQDTRKKHVGCATALDKVLNNLEQGLHIHTPRQAHPVTSDEPALPSTSPGALSTEVILGPSLSIAPAARELPEGLPHGAPYVAGQAHLLTCL